MRLWRLTRTGQTALDGAGTSKHGGRYSPPGAPVVNFASEAGLAVLVALRYLPGDPADAPDDYVLGWTEIDAIPETVRDADGDDAIRAWVTDWLEERRSLLAAVRSQVLPEADVVLMNPLHPDAARSGRSSRGRSASPSASTLRRCWRATPAGRHLSSEGQCPRRRDRHGGRRQSPHDQRWQGAGGSRGTRVHPCSHGQYWARTRWPPATTPWGSSRLLCTRRPRPEEAGLGTPTPPQRIGQKGWLRSGS